MEKESPGSPQKPDALLSRKGNGAVSCWDLWSTRLAQALAVLLLALSGAAYSPFFGSADFTGSASPLARMLSLALPLVPPPPLASGFSALAAGVLAVLVWQGAGLVQRRAGLAEAEPGHPRLLLLPHLALGAGVTLTLAAGMASQGPVPDAGLLAAAVLGLLAAATAPAQEFRDPGRGLPALLGSDRAVLLNLALILPAYLLVGLLLLHRAGIQPRLLGAQVALATLHLGVLAGLRDRSPTHARRAPLLAALIFLASALLQTVATTAATPE